jgi:hypothetical protein
MSTSLYTDRRDISRPIRCETCSAGLAFGNNSHCHRCLDEFWGKSDAEIYSEEICDAARIRIARWYDGDEVIRASGGRRDYHHRFEGVIARRLQDILESNLDIIEKSELVISADRVAMDIEFEYRYNIVPRSIHKAHVELGRLLRAQLPPKRARRQRLSSRVGFSR